MDGREKTRSRGVLREMKQLKLVTINTKDGMERRQSSLKNFQAQRSGKVNGSTIGSDSQYFGRGKLFDGNVMNFVLDRLGCSDLRHPERFNEQLIKILSNQPDFPFSFKYGKN